MELTDSQLQHIARLAALSLAPEEQESLRRELQAILDYVALLAEAPTRGVEPTSQLYAESSGTRDDIVQASLSTEDVRTLAADFAHGGFRVPKVL